MSVSPAPCFSNGGGALQPSIYMDFSYTGPCLVESVYLSANGGAFTMVDVSAEGWSSGDVGQLINLLPNTDYQIYFVTNDGAVSYLYNFTTSDCNNEITICDCSGTQHSIGVTAWLGDGFADNGTYLWAGQYVCSIS